MDELKLVFPDLPYAVEEAMNRLRINVKFCGKNTKKIMLTSCLPNEGKSTVAVYLWKMLAEAGFPSVLVDVDLRNSVLMKSVQVDEVVYKTNIENASIVPCTQLLENPSPLLEDIRFRELLDKLATEYRFVIIDTPPLGSVSDGALIASMCDGALLVIRAGSVPKTIIRQSLHEIDQAGCKLLGTVLNCVEGAGGRYGKYGHYGKYGKYGHYGQYGYGQQAEEENKKSRK